MGHGNGIYESIFQVSGNADISLMYSKTFIIRSQFICNSYIVIRPKIVV